MFHDPNLENLAFDSLAFELNAHAFRLAGLTRWYKRRGERTLPVQAIKRLGFTRREWELATKGSRRYERAASGSRRLVDPAPARDGCEALGILSEYKETCPVSGHVKTYWVIGEVDAAAIAEIHRRREDEGFDVIEDPRPCPEAAHAEPVEPSVPDGVQTDAEREYDRGYAAGEAAGYERGVSDTACANGTSLLKHYKHVPLAHPADTLTVVSKAHLETLLNGFARLASDADDQEAKKASEKHLGF
mgnify:CR=1 FL=1